MRNIMQNTIKFWFTLTLFSLGLIFFVTGCDTKRIFADCPLAAPYCGTGFPLNTQDTTQYGPPWANVSTEFLPCFGPYALCYYSTCTPGSDSTVSICECESLFGLNFVDESAILNKPVYEETIAVCTADPDRCSLPNGAPVCEAMNSGAFYRTVPLVAAISDFSFVGFSAASTNCTNSPGVYSGCMTSACYYDGLDNYICICPTFDGPFQIGGQQNVSCDIQPLTYSAAYNPSDTSPKVPTPPSNINCFPDSGGSNTCPLYTSSTTLPPDSGVNCETVCEEYNTCQSSGVQVGYTCDATLCTTEKKSIYFPACSGLQNCDISEIMKAEFAAGCSCCASQLCGCTPNHRTNIKIDQYNAQQVANEDETQCQYNQTLCGTK